MLGNAAPSATAVQGAYPQGMVPRSVSSEPVSSLYPLHLGICLVVRTASLNNVAQQMLLQKLGLRGSYPAFYGPYSIYMFHIVNVLVEPTLNTIVVVAQLLELKQ